MPEYKLIYFNSKGRAELIRWIFAYSGIAYTDERVEQADWPEKKKSLGGGRLPVLMIDGKRLPQSLAIARYMARITGLLPEDALDSAYCDALIDTFYELGTESYKIIFSEKSEEEKKKALKEDYIPNHVEYVLQRLGKHLEGKEWFAGGKISWGDLAISMYFGELSRIDPDLLKKYPAVDKIVKKVRENPKIKDWIAKRPVTKF